MARFLPRWWAQQRRCALCRTAHKTLLASLLGLAVLLVLSAAARWPSASLSFVSGAQNQGETTMRTSIRLSLLAASLLAAPWRWPTPTWCVWAI